MSDWDIRLCSMEVTATHGDVTVRMRLSPGRQGYVIDRYVLAESLPRQFYELSGFRRITGDSVTVTLVRSYAKEVLGFIFERIANQPLVLACSLPDARLYLRLLPIVGFGCEAIAGSLAGRDRFQYEAPGVRGSPDDQILCIRSQV